MRKNECISIKQTGIYTCGFEDMFKLTCYYAYDLCVHSHFICRDSGDCKESELRRKSKPKARDRSVQLFNSFTQLPYA